MVPARTLRAPRGTRGYAALHPGLSTSAPLGPRARFAWSHAEGMDVDSPGWSESATLGNAVPREDSAPTGRTEASLDDGWSRRERSVRPVAPGVALRSTPGYRRRPRWGRERGSHGAMPEAWMSTAQGVAKAQPRVTRCPTRIPPQRGGRRRCLTIGRPTRTAPQREFAKETVREVSTCLCRVLRGGNWHDI